jgi:hypothetical protein
MSLQAIAGVTYDRRHADSPSTAVTLQLLISANCVGRPETAQPAAAKQLNGTFKRLKKYTPNDLLGICLPIVVIVKNSGLRPDLSVETYAGFVLTTSLVAILLYFEMAAEANTPQARKRLPFSEATLVTASFAIWGAVVTGMSNKRQPLVKEAAIGSAVSPSLILL